MADNVKTTKGHMTQKLLKRTAGLLGGAVSDYFSEAMPSSSNIINDAASTVNDVTNTFRNVTSKVFPRVRQIKSQSNLRNIMNWYLGQADSYDAMADSSNNVDGELNFDGENNEELSADIAEREISAEDKNAAVVSSAVMMATSKSVEANVELTGNIITSIDSQTSIIRAGFDSVNDSISKLTEIVTKNTSAMITASISEKEDKRDYKTEMLEDNRFSLSKYKNMVGENLKNSPVGMLSMLGSFMNPSMAGMLLTPENIVSTVAKFGINKLFPNLEGNLKTLDQEINDTIMASLIRLGDNRNNIFSSIFGIKAAEPDYKVEQSKLELKAIPYDTISKEALVHTIPDYLSKILKAINGEDLKYDFRERTLRTREDMQREFEKNSGISGSFSNARESVREAFGANQNNPFIKVTYDMIMNDLAKKQNVVGANGIVEAVNTISAFSNADNFTKYMEDLYKDHGVDISDKERKYIEGVGQNISKAWGKGIGSDIRMQVAKESAGRNHRMNKYMKELTDYESGITGMTSDLKSDIHNILVDKGMIKETSPIGDEKSSTSSISLSVSSIDEKLSYQNNALYNIYRKLDHGINVFVVGKDESRAKAFVEKKNQYLEEPRTLKKKVDTEDDSEAAPSGAWQSMMDFRDKIEVPVSDAELNEGEEGEDSTPTFKDKVKAHGGALRKAILHGNAQEVRDAFGNIAIDIGEVAKDKLGDMMGKLNDKFGNVSGFLRHKFTGKGYSYTDEEGNQVVVKDNEKGGVLGFVKDSLKDSFNSIKSRAKSWFASIPSMFDYGDKKEDGKVVNKRKKLISSAVGAFAGAGILGGPIGMILGGLTGAALSGSGIGDKIKEFLIGRDSETGKAKGVLTRLVDGVVDPIRFQIGKTMHTFGGVIKKNIIGPISDIGVAIRARVDKNADSVFGKVFSKIGNLILHPFKSAASLVTLPIRLFSKAVGGITRKTMELSTGLFGRTVDAVAGVIGGKAAREQIKERRKKRAEDYKTANKYELDENGEIMYAQKSNGDFILDKEGNKIPIMNRYASFKNYQEILNKQRAIAGQKAKEYTEEEVSIIKTAETSEQTLESSRNIEESVRSTEEIVSEIRDDSKGPDCLFVHEQGIRERLDTIISILGGNNNVTTQAAVVSEAVTTSRPFDQVAYDEDKASLGLMAAQLDYDTDTKLELPEDHKKSLSEKNAEKSVENSEKTVDAFLPASASIITDGGVITREEAKLATDIAKETAKEDSNVKNVIPKYAELMSTEIEEQQKSEEKKETLWDKIKGLFGSGGLLDSLKDLLLIGGGIWAAFKLIPGIIGGITDWLKEHLDIGAAVSNIATWLKNFINPKGGNEDESSTVQGIDQATAWADVVSGGNPVLAWSPFGDLYHNAKDNNGEYIRNSSASNAKDLAYWGSTRVAGINYLRDWSNYAGAKDAYEAAVQNVSNAKTAVANAQELAEITGNVYDINDVVDQQAALDAAEVDLATKQGAYETQQSKYNESKSKLKSSVSGVADKALYLGGGMLLAGGAGQLADVGVTNATKAVLTNVTDLDESQVEVISEGAGNAANRITGAYVFGQTIKQAGKEASQRTGVAKVATKIGETAKKIIEGFGNFITKLTNKIKSSKIFGGIANKVSKIFEKCKTVITDFVKGQAENSPLIRKFTEKATLAGIKGQGQWLAAIPTLTAWLAGEIEGMCNYQYLFRVSPDAVDYDMMQIADIWEGLVSAGEWSALWPAILFLDVADTIVAGLGILKDAAGTGLSISQFLCRAIYMEYVNNGEIKLTNMSLQLDKEIEAYNKNNNANLNAQQYNDMVNDQSWFSELVFGSDVVKKTDAETGQTYYQKITEEEEEHNYEGITGGIKATRDLAIFAGEKIGEGASWVWDRVKDFGSYMSEGVEDLGEIASFVGEKIGDGVSWIGDKLSDFGSGVWDGIKGFGNYIGEGVSDLGELISDGAEAAWDGIKGLGSSIWDGITNLGSMIGEGAGNAVDFLGDLGSSIWDGVTDLGEKIGEGGSSVIDFFGDLGSSIGSGISDFASFIGDKASDAFSWIGDRLSDVGDWFGDRLEDAGSALGWVGDKIGEGASWVGDKVGDFFDWLGFGGPKAIDTPKVPFSNITNNTYNYGIGGPDTNPLDKKAIITSSFGKRTFPKVDDHKGIDLAPADGSGESTVASTAVGTVSYVKNDVSDSDTAKRGRNGKYQYSGSNSGGNQVWIDTDDGRRIKSMHLKASSIPANIKAGSKVFVGTPIGEVGSTGWSTGPHLHYQVEDRYGNAINPGYDYAKGDGGTGASSPTNLADAQALAERQSSEFNFQAYKGSDLDYSRYQNDKAYLLSKTKNEIDWYHSSMSDGSYVASELASRIRDREKVLFPQDATEAEYPTAWARAIALGNKSYKQFIADAQDRFNYDTATKMASQVKDKLDDPFDFANLLFPSGKYGSFYDDLGEDEAKKKYQEETLHSGIRKSYGLPTFDDTWSNYKWSKPANAGSLPALPWKDVKVEMPKDTFSYKWYLDNKMPLEESIYRTDKIYLMANTSDDVEQAKKYMATGSHGQYSSDYRNLKAAIKKSQHLEDPWNDTSNEAEAWARSIALGYKKIDDVSVDTVDTSHPNDNIYKTQDPGYLKNKKKYEDLSYTVRNLLATPQSYAKILFPLGVYGKYYADEPDGGAAKYAAESIHDVQRSMLNLPRTDETSSTYQWKPPTHIVDAQESVANAEKEKLKGMYFVNGSYVDYDTWLRYKGETPDTESGDTEDSSNIEIAGDFSTLDDYSYGNYSSGYESTYANSEKPKGALEGFITSLKTIGGRLLNAYTGGIYGYSVSDDEEMTNLLNRELGVGTDFGSSGTTSNYTTESISGTDSQRFKEVFIEGKFAGGWKKIYEGPGTAVNRFLEFCKTQIGTHENPAKSNNTPYTLWMFKNYSSETASEYPWCMAFVQWCFAKAGFQLSPRTGSTIEFKNAAKAKNNYKSYKVAPKPGDLIFFDLSDRRESEVDHVGIVISGTAGRAKCIEGNINPSGVGETYGGTVAIMDRTHDETKKHAGIDGYVTAIDFDKIDQLLEKCQKYYGTNTEIVDIDPVTGEITTSNGNETYASAGGSSSDLLTDNGLYTYLKGMGYTDAGVAGVMGNWKQESGSKQANRFQCVEGVSDWKDDAAHKSVFDAWRNAGFDKDRASIATNRKGLTDYTHALLKHKGYKVDNVNYHSGGEGYPGLGIAQWTGDRGKKLLDRAVSNNKNWYDPKLQMDLFKDEMTGEHKHFSLAHQALQSATDPAYASSAFASYYEYNDNHIHDDTRDGGRVKYAKEYYEEIKKGNIHSATGGPDDLDIDIPFTEPLVDIPAGAVDESEPHVPFIGGTNKLTSVNKVGSDSDVVDIGKKFASDGNTRKNGRKVRNLFKQLGFDRFGQGGPSFVSDDGLSDVPFSLENDNKEIQSSIATIGHAVSDENNKSKGGKRGDQTGAEVQVAKWYNVLKKPWEAVFRAKSPEKASIMAQTMLDACNNENIGYNQYDRESLFDEAESNGFNVDKVGPVNTDCSALVSTCINAAGIEIPKDLYTGNQAEKIMETGEFMKFSEGYTKNPWNLKKGDILLKQGHTAMVLEDAIPTTTEIRKQFNQLTANVGGSDDEIDKVPFVGGPEGEILEPKVETDFLKDVDNVDIPAGGVIEGSSFTPSQTIQKQTVQESKLVERQTPVIQDIKPMSVTNNNNTTNVVGSSTDLTDVVRLFSTAIGELQKIVNNTAYSGERLDDLNNKEFVDSGLRSELKKFSEAKSTRRSKTVGTPTISKTADAIARG